MKPLAFLLLLLLSVAATSAQSSDLIPFRDSVSHFSIGIPAGWRYKSYTNTSTIKFYAFRTSADTTDRARESYNLNVLRKMNSCTGREYQKLMDALISAGGGSLRKIQATVLPDRGECGA